MLRHAEPRRISLDTAKRHGRRLLRPRDLHSAVVAPIITSDRTMGVLAGWIDDERDGSTDPRLVEALAGVADQAAIALERAELLEQVRHQALHDPLTDLPNASLVARPLGASPRQPRAATPVAGQGSCSSTSTASSR